MSELGKNILELRKKMGLTQEDLGRAVGVSTQAVSRWECGGAPDVLLLPAIADRLGVSIDALFGREGTPREAPEKILRALIEQSPKGKGLETAEKYAWEMMKAVAVRATLESEMYYELLNNVTANAKARVPAGDDKAGGLNNMYNAFGTCEGGVMKASIAADFRYALLMPEPEKGFASILKNMEEYQKLFGLLVKPHWLEMLVYIATRNDNAFTAALAAKKLDLEEPVAAEVLAEMEENCFVYSHKVETENGVVCAYSPREGYDLIPFLYFAGCMMKEKEGGGIGLCMEGKPLLKARPGEGNPEACWNAKKAEKSEETGAIPGSGGMELHQF